MNLWSDLIPWWKGRYPLSFMVIPGDLQSPYVAWFYLLDLVEAGPSVAYLSSISSLIPSLEKKDFTFWLYIYSFRFTVTKIWSPYFIHISICLARSCINACLVHFILLVLLKWVRCWAYTDPVSSVYGGTGRYNVAVWIEEVPWSLNIFQVQLPWSNGSLPVPVFLPVRFTVNRDAFTPYWNRPERVSW